MAPKVFVTTIVFAALSGLVFATHVPCPVTEVTCTCNRSDITCTHLNSVPGFLENPYVWSGLYLADQNVTSLPAGSFRNIIVEKIVLDRNDLNKGLQSESFSEVSGALRVLHMSDCNLRSIPARMLQKMGNLTELHLSDNHLETLPEFTSTPFLKTLMLRGNSIRKLNRTSFSGLKQLERLDLDHNHLRRIDAFHSFHELRALRTLQIAHNQITALHASPFKKLSELRRLSINNNSIRNIYHFTFIGLNNLAVLELQNNVIDWIVNRVFDDLGNLKVLNLASNKLEVLYARSFAKLVNLQEFHLSNNELRDLPGGAFSRMQYLRRVFLDGNSLKTMAQCVFPQHPVMVSAFKNPLECDCDLRYIVARKHATLYVYGMCADHVTSVETLGYDEQCNTEEINCDL